MKPRPRRSTLAKHAIGKSAVGKHSVTIAGHSTSFSLEAPFWSALLAMARSEGRSVAAIVRHIDAGRAGEGVPQANLSSAIRVFVLEWLAAKAGMTSALQDID